MKVKELTTSTYKRPKPEVSFDAKELPEIKSWTVGKKYKLTIEAEMTNMSKTSGDEYEEPGTRARFKVLKVKECDDES